jgi:hypothetical protein
VLVLLGDDLEVFVLWPGAMLDFLRRVVFWICFSEAWDARVVLILHSDNPDRTFF